VTKAIRLLRQFRRQYPDNRGEEIWTRIYPQAIPGYEAMTELEQEDARRILRERVRWRQRATNKQRGATIRRASGSGFPSSPRSQIA